MRKIVYFFCTVIFCFAVVPVTVLADNVDQDGMIELSEQEYQAYIENLLSAPVTIAVDLEKPKDITTQKYESTNAPKPSGAGSVGSSITTSLIDRGIDLIKDVINNSSVDKSSNGFQIPDFRQQIGKLRVVYNSGLVEIVTCSLTTYDTPEIGILGEPTGNYNPHAIVTFIRESDKRYTVTTICDDNSTKYCDSYTTIGTFSIGSYIPYSTVYVPRFFDYETQMSVAGRPYTQINGSRISKFRFSDLETVDEIPSDVFEIANLYFGSASEQGLPEINSGNQYKNLYTLLIGSSVYGGPQSTVSNQGIAFAVVNTVTNNYQDYIQMTDTNDNPDREQKQSITYLSEINSTNIYNENTIKNYDFLSIVDGRITTNNNFDSTFQSWTETINNNVQNIYNNYWYIVPDPTEPPVTVPTDPPITYPPATVPTDPPVTYPPATIPTAEPKYTLDMTAISSDIEELKKQSTSVSIGKSFWVIRVLDYMLNELGLMPLFLLLFFFGILGVLLWK